MVFTDDGRVEDYNSILEEEYSLLTELQKRWIRERVLWFLDENDAKADLIRKDFGPERVELAGAGGESSPRTFSQGVSR